MNYSGDFRELIKKYNEELKKMQQKAAPPAESETIPAQAQVKEREKQPFEFTNSYAFPNINENQMIQGQSENLDSKGQLIVRLSTSNSASPIKGGIVLVSLDTSQGERLIKSLVTNENGETRVITLDTVSQSQSQSPGINNPYASYSIRASADGYFTIDSVNAPIFENIVAIQTIEMIPLPEGFEGDTVLKSNDTGPITLN